MANAQCCSTRVLVFGMLAKGFPNLVLQAVCHSSRHRLTMAAESWEWSNTCRGVASREVSASEVFEGRHPVVTMGESSFLAGNSRPSEFHVSLAVLSAVVILSLGLPISNIPSRRNFSLCCCLRHFSFFRLFPPLPPHLLLVPDMRKL
jgi:hypothetical protein